MPTTPDDREEPELLTIPQLADRHGVSRQTMHRMATTEDGFPRPSPNGTGTRAQYEAEAVDRYIAARVTNPGHRSDLDRKRAEGAAREHPDGVGA